MPTATTTVRDALTMDVVSGGAKMNVREPLAMNVREALAMNVREALAMDVVSGGAKMNVRESLAMNVRELKAGVLSGGGVTEDVDLDVMAVLSL